MPDEPRYRYRIWQTRDGLWSWAVQWGTDWYWHHIQAAKGASTEDDALGEVNGAIANDMDRRRDDAAESAAEWHEIP